MPELAETVLPAHIPDFEVHVWEGDGGYILSHRGDSFQFWFGVRWVEEGLDIFLQRTFPCVIQTEDEDGVFFFAGSIAIQPFS